MAMPASMPSHALHAAEAMQRARDEVNRILGQHTPDPVDDAALTDAGGQSKRLSQFFGRHRHMLLVHNMGKRCAYCSLWADSMIGLAPHIQERCALLLLSPDPHEVLAEFARQRGWQFPCASSAGSDLSARLGFASPDGSVYPGVSALERRDNGTIVRTGSRIFGPGDDFCGLWNLFDLLPGAAAGWTPRR